MDNQQKELARQHTKAVLALTTLTGPLEVLEPAVMPGSKFAKQMQKVMRWRDECAQNLPQAYQARPHLYRRAAHPH